ncbi:MAG: AAA family ATPase [Chloroflexota bacterium]|nr:AAA family ATPase [Chloroflexota bacterium]
MDPINHVRTPTDSDELRIELLGRLRVTLDGVPGQPVPSAKASALLVYLAVTGRPHSREALAGLLWAESDDNDARASLRAVLSQLRKWANSQIVIGHDQIAFDRTSRYWLDVEVFESAVREVTVGPSEASAAAIDLYRGDFLEGFSVRDAPAFDEWVTIQRERLRRLAVDALSQLADRLLLRGNDVAALDHLRRLLALDPWREDAHRQLMLLLTRQGQRAAALAQYEQCRQTLASELGVEPEDETVALAEQIRTGTLTTDVRQDRQSTLPVPPTPMLGRDDDLNRLSAGLIARDDRLITLVGSGGVGKTRLALAAAARVGTHFLHGACFVDLAPVTSPSQVVATLARALGLQESSKTTPKERLIDALRERDILLLLDNLEQVLAATPLIADVLAACPSVTILATSRSPLRVRGERQIPVQPLTLHDI